MPKDTPQTDLATVQQPVELAQGLANAHYTDQAVFDEEKHAVLFASWAGLAVGWIHQAVSLLLEIPYGRGRLLITTFKLNPRTLATDAIAQGLFQGALNLL